MIEAYHPDQDVYVITNSINGKKYVGSSHNPHFRFWQHMSALRHNRHKNIDLQKDFNEYGSDCFTYEIVGQKLHLGQENEERFWMIKLKTYDERHGYNNKDPMMNQIRKANGLSYHGGNNPTGYCGEWWKKRRNYEDA